MSHTSSPTAAVGANLTLAESDRRAGTRGLSARGDTAEGESSLGERYRRNDVLALVAADRRALHKRPDSSGERSWLKHNFRTGWIVTVETVVTATEHRVGHRDCRCGTCLRCSRHRAVLIGTVTVPVTHGETVLIGYVVLA